MAAHDFAEAGLQALLDALTSDMGADGRPSDAALDHASAILDVIHEDGIDSGARKLSATTLAADDDLAANPADQVFQLAQQALAATTQELRDRFAAALVEIDPTTALAQLRALLSEYNPVLASLLADVQLTAVLTGMQVLAQRTEEETLPVPLDPLPTWADMQAAHGDRDAEPNDLWPVIDAAVADLRSRQLLTRAEYDALMGEARAQAFTVAGIEEEAALGRVRDLLADTVEEGGSAQDFRKAIVGQLGASVLTPAHTETVFRNAVNEGYSRGQERLLAQPLVDQLFPYAEYVPIRDDRARPEHRALEKLGIQGTAVYRRDDPVWQLFRPPWAHGCRCGWIALSIRDAADRGIAEAQEWLRTGVPPTRPAHVPMPPFRPEAGWLHTLGAFVEGEHPRGQLENKGEFAPKGEQTSQSSTPDTEAKRTPEQAAQEYQQHGTKAAAFKKWFGDWEQEPEKASKVVDEEGSPQETYGEVKKVFHGTKADFNSFDNEKLGSQTQHPTAIFGHFFSESPDVARIYAGDKFERKKPKTLDQVARVKFGKPYAYLPQGSSERQATLDEYDAQPLVNIQTPNPDGRTIEAYLNIRNPYVMPFEDFFPFTKFPKNEAHAQQIRDMAKALKDKIVTAGHDGICVEPPTGGDIPQGVKLPTGVSEHDSRSWVAFEPTQIKAVANAGTFDPASPNMTLATEDDGGDESAALARFYAALWNDLKAAGVEIAEEDQDVALAELDGWTLTRDEDGIWEAAPEDDATELSLGDGWTLASVHAPVGGVTIGGTFYQGGRFIPGSAIAHASEADKARLKVAQDKAETARTQKADARRARGSVGVEALRQRLAPHAEKQPLTATDQRQAGQAFRMLQRHHGDLALHRVEELADQVEAALQGIDDDHPNADGLREQLTGRLHQLHHMLGLHEQHESTRLPWESKTGTVDAGKVYQAPVEALHVDPTRFQFKLNVDKSGVTEELKGVRTFNPDFAGVVSVWKDPVDGKTYVINGHHRHELARRTGHPDLAVRYIDAPDAVTARGVGAMINIAEGRGTAVDAAKFLRDMNLKPEEAEAKGISLKGRLAQDAIALTRLNDRLFDKVARGQFELPKALAVASHLEDHDLQDKLFSLLDKREEAGKDITLRTVEEMARGLAAAGKVKTTEKTLFGDIESEESTFVEESELKAFVRAELAKEVNDFAAVANQRRAEKVGKVGGNVIDVATNKVLAEEASEAKGVYDTLVNSRGEISDTIRSIAAEYKTAKTRSQRDAIKRRAADAVRQAIARESDATGSHPDGSGAAAGTEPATGTEPAPADGGRGAAAPAGVATSHAPDTESTRSVARFAVMQNLSTGRLDTDTEKKVMAHLGAESLADAYATLRKADGKTLAEVQRIIGPRRGNGSVPENPGAWKLVKGQWVEPTISTSEKANGGDGDTETGGTPATESGGTADRGQSVAGGTDGGSAGRPTQPRILTARAELTSPADTAVVPEGLQQHLDANQVQGAAKAVAAVDAHGGFLLADGTGVGKTRQQLAIAQTYAGRGKKVLLVAPAGVLKQDWVKGTVSGSYADDSAKMGVALRLNRGDEALTPGQVHVTTYENLGKIKDQVDSDTVILFDESHNLKNWAAARAKHASEMSKKALGVVYATATPADKPLHIAHLFRAKVFGNRKWEETYRDLGMRQREIHTPNGTVKKWEIDPKVGHAESYRRMSGLFDRMTEDGLMLKREVSLDGLDVGIEHVAMPPEAEAEMKEIEGRYEPHQKGIIRMAQRMAQERYKVDAAVSSIKKELAEGRQVVLFGASVNATGEEDEGSEDKGGLNEGTMIRLREALQKEGIPFGELHGAVTKTQQRKAMDDFQSGTKKVMIGTVQSGGVGINLDDRVGTQPRTLLMLTPPFSAVDNIQAAGRIHRRTTQSNSRIRYLLADTPIDRWNAALIAGKMKTLNATVGGDVALLDIPAEEAEKIDPREKAAQLIAEKGRYQWPSLTQKSAATKPGASTATVSISGNTFPHKDAIKAAGGRWDGATGLWTIPVEHAARLRNKDGLRFSDDKAPATSEPAKTVAPAEPATPSMSATRKEAIHQALRQLAGNDSDRARERNDVGFNQIDSAFGAQLAEQGELTDRQAEAAARMLTKYRRQLGDDLHGRIAKEEPPMGVPEATKPTPPVPTKAHTHFRVSGNTFEHKDAIKRRGGRWDGDSKTWVIPKDAGPALESLRGLRLTPTTLAQTAFLSLAADAGPD